MSARVLVTCAQMQRELDVHLDRLTGAGYEVASPAIPGQRFSAAELAPQMAGVVGMIAGDDELNAAFFDAAPDLSVLVRWGIGMDSVDHTAAAAHGVTVRNTPGVFGDEVADSAFAYLLLLARGHHEVDRSVRAGDWVKREGVSLAGTTLGVIGLGDIGRGVVRRAAGFGMEILGYDPYVDRGLVDPGVEVVERLQDLLSRARFVVVTAPLTPQTFHLLDAAALAAMREDAYLVNVARGPLVDEQALTEALVSGAIAGAGLDVFEVEPLPEDSLLRTLPCVVLGAHNGSNTRQGVARASTCAIEILLEELARA